jgi:hypothetical protein
VQSEATCQLVSLRPGDAVAAPPVHLALVDAEELSLSSGRGREQDAAAVPGAFDVDLAEP